ncbi:unknown [Bacteroides stercoris CAG:120]|nr:unknown [Bacteroides stercoris CAG:120]
MSTTFRQMFIITKLTFRRSVSHDMYLTKPSPFDPKPFGYKIIQTG